MDLEVEGGVAGSIVIGIGKEFQIGYVGQNDFIITANFFSDIHDIISIGIDPECAITDGLEADFVKSGTFHIGVGEV